MWFRCRYPGCNRMWSAHDSSTSVKPGLCREHKEAEKERQCLPTRGPMKPYDDYHRRPARVELLLADPFSLSVD